MASTTPAHRIGAANIGEIAVGNAAHLTAWNEELQPVKMWAEAEPAENSSRPQQ